MLEHACALVPAYQAERSVAGVVSGLRAALPELEGAIVVSHGENRGKGAALRTGLREARARGFRVALAVDADGQHPAASARAVLEASDDPRALVLGVRDLLRDGAPRANQISNGISNFFLSRFAGRPLRDTQCGLRRYPVRETLALGARADGFAFEAEVILRALSAKLPVVEVPVSVVYPSRDERRTHFHNVRDPASIVGTVVRTVLELRTGRGGTP